MKTASMRSVIPCSRPDTAVWNAPATSTSKPWASSEDWMSVRNGGGLAIKAGQGCGELDEGLGERRDDTDDDQRSDKDHRDDDRDDGDGAGQYA